jgi:Putative prokaryotic signal transducing protein
MDDQLVTVRNCNYLHEAEFIKSVLEADGIDADIPDQYMAAVQPGLGGTIGGIRVTIRSSDLEKAERTLAAVIPGE